MRNKGTKSKCLAQITIEKETYSIRATGHALDRMRERKIDEWVVSGDIIAFGKQRLLEFKNTNEEVILIDKKRNIAIVWAFIKNTVYLITVIDKSEVYVLDGTVIKNLEV